MSLSPWISRVCSTGWAKNSHSVGPIKHENKSLCSENARLLKPNAIAVLAALANLVIAIAYKKYA